MELFKGHNHATKELVSSTCHATQNAMKFDYDHIHLIENGLQTKLPLAIESIGFCYWEHERKGAQEKLAEFSAKVDAYSADRYFLDIEATSHLGVDLRFGTISVREVLRWLVERKKEGVETEPFFRQLIFREFYAMLLYHMPHLERENFRYRFCGEENKRFFEAFCTAQTGVDVVDAAICELLQTGFMHNRARMICASYFCKNLLLPWQMGERFFAKHLLDYDASSNILSWQWSAGSGVDPQPYFRIFNPYRQAEKFDKKSAYVEKFLGSTKRAEPIVDFTASSKKSIGAFW